MRARTAGVRVRGTRFVAETSVRARLLDLLEIHDGEWFTIRGLRDEYSARFGPVTTERLRREIFKELERDDAVVRVRLRSDLTPAAPTLQITCEGPIFRYEEA